MLISYTRLTEYQLGPSTDKRLVAYISLSIYDRLRSASGLKSASTDVIISNRSPILKAI